MTRAVLVSVEEYLSTTYRPDREYIEGTVLERNVGEYEHSRTQTLLSGYLLNREEQWGIQALVEQRVQVHHDHYRVPDVCVVADRQPQDPILTRPPLAVIEILSKDDRLEEMQDRVNDYLAFGVRHVWMLNPRARRAWRCAGDGMYEVRDGILRTQEPEIVIPLAEIWSRPRD